MRSVRERTSKKAHFSEENVLPMINVVFLLLIFFMIAGHIAASDPLELSPLYSQSEARKHKEPLTIYLAKDDQINLEGRFYALDQLPTVLTDLSVEASQPKMLLKVDANYNGQSLLKILGLLREHGMENVRLITQLPEENS